MNTQRVEETAEETISGFIKESEEIKDGRWICGLCGSESAVPITTCSKCNYTFQKAQNPEVAHPIPDGAEVWDKDSIPFDVALEVVKREMAEAATVIKARGHNHWQSVFLLYANDAFKFMVYGNTGCSAEHETLGGALRNLSNPIDKKANRIATLRAELAALEREEA